MKDKSKVVLVEDTTNWEKRLVELRKSDAAAKACKAVAEVQQLVDQISGQVGYLSPFPCCYVALIMLLVFVSFLFTFEFMQ